MSSAPAALAEFKYRATPLPMSRTTLSCPSYTASRLDLLRETTLRGSVLVVRLRHQHEFGVRLHSQLSGILA